MIDARPGNSSRTALGLVLWGGLALAIGVAGVAGVRSLAHRSISPAALEAASSSGSISRAGVSGRAGASGTNEAAGAPSIAAGASGSTHSTNPDAAAADTAPDFSLTDRSGRTVTLADLRGKVWIANFIFTRCGTVCPTLTREMSRVREALAKRGAPNVLSVSFTVDPVYDTPAVLKKYADGFHADASSWFFLTGDPGAVLHVVKDGFHLMMNDPGAGAPMHSNRFIIVDAQGRLRSSHLGTEEGVVDAIVKDVLALQPALPDRTSLLGGPHEAAPSGVRLGVAANRRKSLLTPPCGGRERLRERRAELA